MQNKDTPKVKDCKASDNWTCISFKPDLAKFGMTALDDYIVALMKRRVYDMAVRPPPPSAPVSAPATCHHAGAGVVTRGGARAAGLHSGGEGVPAGRAHQGEEL